MTEFNTNRCPLRIYGIPCNQFGLQEPGAGVEIFNSVKYVRPGNGFEPRFDLLVKRHINGAKEDKLFSWLKVRIEELCHWEFFRNGPHCVRIQFSYHVNLLTLSFRCFKEHTILRIEF